MARRVYATRRSRFPPRLTIIVIALVWSWPSSPTEWKCSQSGVSECKKNHSIGFASALRLGSKEQRKKEESVAIEEDSKSLDVQAEAGDERKLSLNQLLIKAGKRGLGGGIPGAIAGVVQVVTLMWLRTIINYQSRYGTPFLKSVGILYREGGIKRFYRGLTFALFQAPIARFVSTAANDGVEALLAHLDLTKDWGAGRTTVVASLVVGFWRMMLMPLDTCKTVLQVDSVEGFRNLMRRVKAGKIGVLYQGAIANAVSALMGHYPWFFTYNALSKSEWLQGLIPSILLRNAGIGLVASIVSDTFVNAVRVVKTTKQAVGSKHEISYADVVRMVLAADGWRGLFGRGLQTRIFANALQSIVFTVIWRGLSDRWTGRSLSYSSGEEQSEVYGNHDGDGISSDKEDDDMKISKVI